VLGWVCGNHVEVHTVPSRHGQADRGGGRPSTPVGVPRRQEPGAAEYVDPRGGPASRQQPDRELVAGRGVGVVVVEQLVERGRRGTRWGARSASTKSVTTAMPSIGRGPNAEVALAECALAVRYNALGDYAAARESGVAGVRVRSAGEHEPGAARAGRSGRPRRPATARGGAVSGLVLLVGGGSTLLEIAEPISRIPPIAAAFGTFESPLQLPLWLALALALGLGAAAAAVERAMRMRYRWLLDSGAGT
jgi:hypothetical protein